MKKVFTSRVGSCVIQSYVTSEYNNKYFLSSTSTIGKQLGSKRREKENKRLLIKNQDLPKLENEVELSTKILKPIDAIFIKMSYSSCLRGLESSI